MDKLRVLVIVGATAVGKTKLSIQLAKALDAEIVNGDALQVYRGLDIATAKATARERNGVPHHLLSFLQPNDTLTVREYRDRALRTIQDISSRGRLPIVVGGTMYYIQSLLWPSLIDEETDWDDPAIEYDVAEKKYDDDKMSLYKKLEDVDPMMARRLHPNDIRKIKRSLDIHRSTGKRHSDLIVEQRARERTAQPRFECRAIWLDCSSEKIYENRVVNRIESMLKDGLLDEVDRLWCELRGEEEATAGGVAQAIGFKEFLPWCELPKPRPTYTKNVHRISADHLGKEDDVLSRCLSRLYVNTRQYSKTQLRWITNRFSCRNIQVTRLDTSNVTEWDDQVYRVALDVAKRLNAGETLSSEECAKLEKRNEAFWAEKDIQTWQKFYCETCGVTLNGSHEWSVHLKSKRHHRRKRGIARREQWEAFRKRRRENTNETDPSNDPVSTSNDAKDEKF